MGEHSGSQGSDIGSFYGITAEGLVDLVGGGSTDAFIHDNDGLNGTAGTCSVLGIAST